MKPPPVSYARPRTVREAWELLAADDDAKVIAGGQSLVPLLNFRLARPTTLVDVTGIEGLSAIACDGAQLVVGAAVRQRALERSPAAADACPLLAQALRYVGHLQTRTRGTVGGSIAHADPAAELPAVAVALDAEIVAAGPRGERVLPAEGFFLGPLTPALEGDEVLTEVRFPVGRWHRTAFRELARRSGDFALAGVAAAVRFEQEGGGAVSDARLVGLGVDAVPLRLREAEQLLLGTRLDADAITSAAQAAASAAQPMNDVNADAAYRRRLLATLVETTLEELAP